MRLHRPTLFTNLAKNCPLDVECLNLFHSVKVVTQYLHLLQKEYKQFVFFNPMFWVRNENYCMCCCALQNVDLILASQSLRCS